MKLIFELKLPEFDNTVLPNDIKERIQNALLLGAFGDALGNPVEFAILNNESTMCTIRSLGGLVKNKEKVAKESGRPGNFALKMVALLLPMILS